MKQSSRKLNNAGMSLVEIVVVVLIIGILAAGSVVGLAFINSMDATSAAESTMSMLERTRLNTLSAESSANIRMELLKEDKHYYVRMLQGDGANLVELDKVEIGGNGLEVTVTSNSGSETTIADGASVVFTYNKSNGSFSSAYVKVTFAGTKTCEICLVEATGRCYLK